MEKEYYEGLQDGSVVKGEHHIYNKDGEYIFSTLDKEIANDIIEMVNTYIKVHKMTNQIIERKEVKDCLKCSNSMSTENDELVCVFDKEHKIVEEDGYYVKEERSDKNNENSMGL